MKTRLILSVLLFMSSVISVMSQVPQGFNYQAIARDASGNPIVNTAMPVRITIQSELTGGTIFWQEVHSSVTTNSFGMLTLVVGQGVKQAGTAATFADINWSVSPKYIKTEIDYGGWKDMGVSPLWSVPYAQMAKSSEQWQTSGTNIYRLNGNVGIGTANPESKLHIQGDISIPYYAGNPFLKIKMGLGNTFFFRQGDNNISVTSDHTGNPTIMTIDKFGNVGIPKLMAGNYSGMVGNINAFSMEIGGSSPTATNGQATLFLHHHGNVAHQLRYTSGNLYLEAAGNGYGTTNTPNLHIGGGLFAALNGGNVGIGTDSPTSKVVIQPPSTWDDNIPLFEVKNKYGYPVLAVYNNGVRILVEDTDGKGPKGGFAIGGFDPTKAGETVNLMMVSSDSVRISIDNSSGKGVKGGFAIGSFDNSKAEKPREFMQIMPQSSVSGEYNTFIGYEAGKNIQGPHNTVIGKKAGYSLPNNKAAANVFIGEGAGMNNFGGYDLYTITLPDNSSTTAFDSYGGENVAIGYYSGVQLSGDALHKSYGKRNVLVGAFSGYKLKEGRENTIIGYSAGANLTTGRGNVFIGFRAGEQETGNYKLYIDNSNTTTPLIYGDFDLNYIRINGDIQYTGTISQVSDINLKTNIKKIENPLEKLMKIRGITFNWNEHATNDLVVSGRNQIGVLAQEVELVYPELVSENEKGYKTVDYIKLTPILLEAVKEQQKQIEAEKEENRKLKEELETLKAEFEHIKTTLTVAK